jgi:hypothetical protein
MDILSNLDVWAKLLTLAITFIASFLLMDKFMPLEKDEEFLDVPDFIKGKDSDFYGN